MNTSRLHFPYLCIGYFLKLKSNISKLLSYKITEYRYTGWLWEQNFDAMLSSKYHKQTIYGPRQANLVLITYASSEGSGEPAHPRILRCSLIQAVSQEEPSDRKPDLWPLWMAGHAQLKLVMTECSKTQIRLTRHIDECGKKNFSENLKYENIRI